MTNTINLPDNVLVCMDCSVMIRINVYLTGEPTKHFFKYPAMVQATRKSIYLHTTHKIKLSRYKPQHNTKTSSQSQHTSYGSTTLSSDNLFSLLHWVLSSYIPVSKGPWPKLALGSFSYWDGNYSQTVLNTKINFIKLAW